MFQLFSAPHCSRDCPQLDSVCGSAVATAGGGPAARRPRLNEAWAALQALQDSAAFTSSSAHAVGAPAAAHAALDPSTAAAAAPAAHIPLPRQPAAAGSFDAAVAADLASVARVAIELYQGRPLLAWSPPGRMEASGSSSNGSGSSSNGSDCSGAATAGGGPLSDPAFLAYQNACAEQQRQQATAAFEIEGTEPWASDLHPCRLGAPLPAAPADPPGFRGVPHTPPPAGVARAAGMCLLPGASAAGVLRGSGAFPDWMGQAGDLITSLHFVGFRDGKEAAAGGGVDGAGASGSGGEGSREQEEGAALLTGSEAEGGAGGASWSDSTPAWWAPADPARRLFEMAESGQLLEWLSGLHPSALELALPAVLEALRAAAFGGGDGGGRGDDAASAPHTKEAVAPDLLGPRLCPALLALAAGLPAAQLRRYLVPLLAELASARGEGGRGRGRGAAASGGGGGFDGGGSSGGARRAPDAPSRREACVLLGLEPSVHSEVLGRLPLGAYLQELLPHVICAGLEPAWLAPISVRTTTTTTSSSSSKAAAIAPHDAGAVPRAAAQVLAVLADQLPFPVISDHVLLPLLAGLPDSRLAPRALVAVAAALPPALVGPQVFRPALALAAGCVAKLGKPGDAAAASSEEDGLPAVASCEAAAAHALGAAEALLPLVAPDWLLRQLPGGGGGGSGAGVEGGGGGAAGGTGGAATGTASGASAAAGSTASGAAAAAAAAAAGGAGAPAGGGGWLLMGWPELTGQLLAPLRGGSSPLVGSTQLLQQRVARLLVRACAAAASATAPAAPIGGNRGPLIDWLAPAVLQPLLACSLLQREAFGAAAGPQPQQQQQLQQGARKPLAADALTAPVGSALSTDGQDAFWRLVLQLYAGAAEEVGPKTLRALLTGWAPTEAELAARYSWSHGQPPPAPAPEGGGAAACEAGDEGAAARAGAGELDSGEVVGAAAAAAVEEMVRELIGHPTAAAGPGGGGGSGSSGALRRPAAAAASRRVAELLDQVAERRGQLRRPITSGSLASLDGGGSASGEAAGGSGKAGGGSVSEEQQARPRPAPLLATDIALESRRQRQQQWERGEQDPPGGSGNALDAGPASARRAALSGGPGADAGGREWSWFSASQDAPGGPQVARKGRSWWGRAPWRGAQWAAGGGGSGGGGTWWEGVWSLQATVVHSWPAHREKMRCLAVDEGEQFVVTAGEGLDGDTNRGAWR